MLVLVEQVRYMFGTSQKCARRGEVLRQISKQYGGVTVSMVGVTPPPSPEKLSNPAKYNIDMDVKMFGNIQSSATMFD